MKNFPFIIMLIILSLLSACGLDRSNPLDPASGNITTPSLVTGIDLSSSGQGAQEKFIDITWTSLNSSEADGYFIYRSRSYDGSFDLIKVMYGSEQNNYRDRYKIVTGQYFYKMSAFIYLHPESPNENERLEGPLNRPGDVGIVVPQ